MTRYLAMISGKGGVGKSTSSINLAAALNYFGKDVIVVDGNLTTPNVGIHLGFPVAPIHIHHVLQGKNKMKEAVYLHPQNIKIVPGSIALADLKLTNPDRMPKALKDLAKLNPDFVVIDGAAGLGREALAAITAADSLLIVTNPELPAITDALKTIKLAEELDKEVLGVVVTKSTGSRFEVNLKNIESMLEKPVISVVPYDESVKESLAMRDAVVFTHPKCKASVAYKKLAASISSSSYTEEHEDKEGFLVSFFKRLRRKGKKK